MPKMPFKSWQRCKCIHQYIDARYISKLNINKNNRRNCGDSLVRKVSIETCSQESRHFSDERFKGTSFGSVATMGLAMVGIAATTSIPVPLVVGAVVSGAWLGDKMSPLSDTTNLASGVSKVPLYDHIHFLECLIIWFTLRDINGYYWTWYIVIDPSNWSSTIYFSFLSTFDNRGWRRFC